MANVASLAVALLFTKFVRDELGDEIALLSLAFFCFFPASMFLSAGYSESLCLVFVLLGFVFLAREKFVLAALMGSLALGTRSAGIVMILPIVWEIWRRNAVAWPRRLSIMALCGVVAISSLLALMAYDWIEFGTPLAFAIAQGAWNPGSFPDRFGSAVTLAPFLDFDWRGGASFVFVLALALWSFRHLRASVSLYGLGVLMLPYLTLTMPVSMNRFVVMCFPAFLCLGVLCKGRAWLTAMVIGLFAPLLLVITALFSQWYWVG